MAKSGKPKTPPIVVVSGGDGSSGDQLLQTALAQFPDRDVRVTVIAGVRSRKRVEAAVRRAKREGATILHTFVDADLRRMLVREARQEHVAQIDLIGRVMTRLSSVLQEDPLEQPGRYRRLNEDYFERVEAIEFAVTHDDGLHTEDLDEADIVLVGPSRVGKTPLSMFLSVLGWKAANVPFVKGIPLPEDLSKADRRRVVGVVVDAARLKTFRARRQENLGMSDEADYGDFSAVRNEVEACRRECRRREYSVLDATNRPIEESAEEATSLVEGRLRDG